MEPWTPGEGVNRRRAPLHSFFRSTGVLAVSVQFLVAAASVVGCGIVKPPLFLALETEHFEIYREEGLPAACAATGTTFEGFFRAFEDYLDVQLAAGSKIIYNQFITYTYVAELCDL